MNTLVLEDVHRQLGASFVEALGFQLPESYGSPEREAAFVQKTVGLVDQSYRGVLHLKGTGAGEALNRVFSSRVASLAPGQGQTSCLLTAKGRILGAFFLCCMAKDEYRLVTREPMRDELVKSIRKYVMLADIDVSDVSSETALLALQGPAAGRVLEESSGATLPLPSPGQVVSLEIAAVECLSTEGKETPEGGFELWVPAAALEDVWRCVHGAVTEAGGGVVGHAAAEVLRVEAGEARYGKDYDEDSFPQEIGWEHALTYDKCYVGQEIVARMHTYGEVNRKLRGLLIAGNLPSVPGSVVRVGEDEAGVVTSSVVSGRLGQVLALARVKRKYWEATSMTVDGSDHPTEAEQVDLPFVRLDD